MENSPIQPDAIIAGECIGLLNALREPAADLIFADPPFNIGYKYDCYEDRKAYDEYFDWTSQWMRACAEKALKPAGSFWIAIGDEYAAEVRIIARRLGLNLRNWVIWHYTFGQATKLKFARSHAHLFYFTKDARKFTFNDTAVRMPSARQTTYADRRANPAGKLPDDVWSFSRVCGTFNERVDWHPCQMPEKVLERIIKVSSSDGDVVLDPFSGSGTTCCTAARLKRRYIGIEISENYVECSRQRLADTLAGRRPTTDISENPEALRHKRAVGKKSESDPNIRVRKSHTESDAATC
ncbi:MAG: site-specific DNA-methyltransferase [Planctomycetes bacterium]|nr:site-specific DNA-methyltransferase [Planctomycetota bacterium]